MILHLASWYPNEVLPTNGNFVERHIACLGRGSDFHQVITIQEDSRLKAFCFRIDDGDFHDSVSGERVSGGTVTPRFRVVCVYYGSLRGIFKWLYLLWAKVKAYRLALAAIPLRQVHLCHAHVAWDAALLAWVLYKTRSIPYIITEHATVYTPENPQRIRGIKKWLLRNAFRNAKQVLPVSEHLGKSLRELGFIDSYRVVPNVVDTTVFYPLERQPQRVHRFLHVADLGNPGKNTPGIVRAVAALHKQGHAVSLTAVGERHEVLLKEIRETQTDHTVLTILPVQPLARIAHLMQTHDTLVLNSQYENLPCVIAEAHCCGLPVIATSVGGVPEMITPGENGFLIPPNQEQALREAMVQRIQGKGGSDAARIAGKAAAYYGKAALNRQILAVYDEVASGC